MPHLLKRRRFLRPRPTTGPTVLLWDKFTDTNGTALGSHAFTDVGPSGWTVGLGTDANITIQSDRAESASFTVEYRIAQSNGADVTITATLNVVSKNPTVIDSILARYADSNNFWQLSLFDDGFYLHEMNGGTLTQRGFVAKTWSLSTDYAFQWVMSGDNHTGTVDGGSEITYSSSFNASETKHGLKMLGFGTWEQRMDDFKVVTP